MPNQSQQPPVTCSGIFGGQEAVDAAREALFRALSATARVRGPNRTYVDVADHRIQIQAANAILDRELGKAPQKAEITTRSIKTGDNSLTTDDLMELGRKDPEAVARIADAYLSELKSAEVVD